MNESVMDVVKDMVEGVVPTHKFDEQILLHYAKRLLKAYENETNDVRQICLNQERLVQMNDTEKRNKALLELAGRMRKCREEGEFDSSYLRDWADCIEKCVTFDNDYVNLLFHERFGKRLDSIEKTLEAKLRNANRFSTEEEAQVAFLNEEQLISCDSTKDDPFDEWTDEMKRRYSKWLFETPEETRSRMQKILEDTNGTVL